jgi:hypothetical protein
VNTTVLPVDPYDTLCVGVVMVPLPSVDAAFATPPASTRLPDARSAIATELPTNDRSGWNVREVRVFIVVLFPFSTKLIAALVDPL